MPLPVKAPACPPLRLLAALPGVGGHQDGPEQYRPPGHRRRHGVIRSAPPPPTLQVGPGRSTHASATRSVAQGFFNALNRPLRDFVPARGGLPMVAAQNRVGDLRGGDAAARPGSTPDAPAASGGGKSGCTSPDGPPFGEASGSGPPVRLEGVYTPTAHKGAPARGDGTGSSLGEGCSPGNGKGPHAAVGGWRIDRGPSRRGTAAPPRTESDRRSDRPPPPPPERAPPVRGRTAMG